MVGCLRGRGLGGRRRVGHAGGHRCPERSHVRPAGTEALLHGGVDLGDDDVVTGARDEGQRQVLGVGVRVALLDAGCHGAQQATPLQVGRLVLGIGGVLHERGTGLAGRVELVGGDQRLGRAQFGEISEVLHTRRRQHVVLHCELGHVSQVGLDDLGTEHPVHLAVPLRVDDLVHVGRRRDGRHTLELQAGLGFEFVRLDTGPHRRVPALAVACSDEVLTRGHAGPALLGRCLQGLDRVEEVTCLLRTEDVGLLLTRAAVHGNPEVVGHHNDVALLEHLVEVEAHVEEVDVHPAGPHRAVAHGDRRSATADGALVGLADGRVRPGHDRSVRRDIVGDHHKGGGRHRSVRDGAATVGVRHPSLVRVHHAVLLAGDLAVRPGDRRVCDAGGGSRRGGADLRHDQIVGGLQGVLDRQLGVGHRKLLRLHDDARLRRQFEGNVVQGVAGVGEDQVLRGGGVGGPQDGHPEGTGARVRHVELQVSCALRVGDPGAARQILPVAADLLLDRNGCLGGRCQLGGDLVGLVDLQWSGRRPGRADCGRVRRWRRNGARCRGGLHRHGHGLRGGLPGFCAHLEDAAVTGAPGRFGVALAGGLRSADLRPPARGAAPLELQLFGLGGAHRGMQDDLATLFDIGVCGTDEDGSLGLLLVRGREVFGDGGQCRRRGWRFGWGVRRRRCGEPRYCQPRHCCHHERRSAGHVASSCCVQQTVGGGRSVMPGGGAVGAYITRQRDTQRDRGRPGQRARPAKRRLLPAEPTCPPDLRRWR